MDVIIQELIRIAIQRLSKQQNYPYVSKKKILKTLFQTKERLSNENPIKSCLAYYWYKEGPYSEIIYVNIDHLVSDGKIKIDRQGDRTTCRFDPNRALNPITPHNDNMNEASEKIRQVVEQFPHIGAVIKDIYDSAPFEWYSVYNLEFKVKFEDFCKSIQLGQEHHESRYTNNDILDSLDNAVLGYPPFPKFMEHRRIFMDFAKILNAFLRSDTYLKHKDKFMVLQERCNRIWDVFAYGVRLEHHDDYYDDRINSWKEKYEQELNDLDIEIRKQVKIFETIAVDTRRFIPEVEDIVCHPEKHSFKPFILDDIIEEPSTGS